MIQQINTKNFHQTGRIGLLNTAGECDGYAVTNLKIGHGDFGVVPGQAGILMDHKRKGSLKIETVDIQPVYQHGVIAYTGDGSIEGGADDLLYDWGIGGRPAAEESGANWFFGVDMSILGPVVAEQYGLQYSGTKDPEVVRACLQKGGCVIANVTGNREGHVSLFSKVRHYIVVLSIDGDEVCILDPSYKEGKYEEEGRAGKARVDAPFVYCSLQDLQEDCICANPMLEKHPYYHLFTRK